MSKLTAEQILEILEEKYKGDVSAYAFGSYPDSFRWEYYHTAEEREKAFEEFLGLGKFKEIEQRGGEGQGDTWYVVNHFVDHDVMIRTSGWYSSYNGTEFEDGFGKEVKPVQRTVTFYE